MVWRLEGGVDTSRSPIVSHPSPIVVEVAVDAVDFIFQWIGMVEYIPCYSAPELHSGLHLPLG